MSENIKLTGISVNVPGLSKDEIHLDVTPGFNVFYGLNGVGKSRLLASVKDGKFSLKAPYSAEVRGSLLPPANFSFDSDGELLGPDLGRVNGPFLRSLAASSASSIEAFFDELKSVLNELDDSVFPRSGGNATKWRWRILYWIFGYARLPKFLQLRAALAVSELIAAGNFKVQRQAKNQWLVVSVATLHSQEFAQLTEFIQKVAADVVETFSDELSDPEVLVDGDDLRWKLEAIDDGLLLNLIGLENEFPSWAAVNALRPSTDRNEEFGHSALLMEILRELSGSYEYLTPLPDPPEPYESVFFGIKTGTSPVEIIDVDEKWEEYGTDSAEKMVESGMRGQRTEVFLANFTELSQKGSQAIQEISSDANEIFQDLLITAPQLRITTTHPSQWTTQPRLLWQAEDKQGRWVHLEELSDTQRRLAQLAIRLANPSMQNRLAVMLFDEPERGLHRLAEIHLRQGLIKLSQRYTDMVIMVSSHSPAFLMPEKARLHHVSRNTDGQLTVEPLESATLENASQLGITTSELLQLTRIVVLVEGTHDEWVLNELFHDEFERLGVRVIPMRGATKLVAQADANLLFNFTDIHLVVMLDNISQERAKRFWEEAIEAKTAGEPLGAIDTILQKMAPKKRKDHHEMDPQTEFGALIEFCQAALRKDRQDRIVFGMLEKGDIEFYLDPKHFLNNIPSDGDVPTWEELQQRHSEAKTSTPGTGNFKKWLTSTGQARFNRERWVKAVQDLDEAPLDLLNVMHQIEIVHDIRVNNRV